MKSPARPVAPLFEADLRLRACELFPGPDSGPLRAAWLRAVALVRSTHRGWVLDRGTPRLRWGWYIDPSSRAKP